MRPVPRLIVNADDYGLTPGVSRGILEAHHKGVVHSTSVMISSPGVAAALREAINTAPGLGLGLHFTLSGTGSRPILPPEQVQSLVQEDGTFYPFEEWLTHYEQFSPAELSRELTAQCECLVDLAGKPPDHLDAHHHVIYRHPAALRTAFELAQRYNIPVRNPGFDHALPELLSGISSPARETAQAEINDILAGEVPRWPDHFESGFYDRTATLGDLLLILANLPEGITELMCHPGYADDLLTFRNDYTVKREAELAALTHTSVREMIRAEGIALVRFGDL